MEGVIITVIVCTAVGAWGRSRDRLGCRERAPPGLGRTSCGWRELWGPEGQKHSSGSPDVFADGPDSAQLWSTPTALRGIVTAELGSQVQMECTATSEPRPKYYWSHNGSLLSFLEKNITLPNLTWEQMGRYRCVLENPVVQLTLYREVLIQAPSECSHSPSGAHAPQILPPPCLCQGSAHHQGCHLHLAGPCLPQLGGTLLTSVARVQSCLLQEAPSPQIRVRVSSREVRSANIY